MKYNSAGALLFAIIISFVLSLTAATLILLTINQYRIVNSAINRAKAYYRVRAVNNYAVYQAYTNTDWLPDPGATKEYVYQFPSQPVNIPVNITITNPDPEGLSNYRFQVTTDYES